jgi:hypothetical protein
MKVHVALDPKLAPVRDAFAEHFEQGLDIGASVAVTVNGAPGVDPRRVERSVRGLRPWSVAGVRGITNATSRSRG